MNTTVGATLCKGCRLLGFFLPSGKIFCNSVNREVSPVKRSKKVPVYEACPHREHKNRPILDSSLLPKAAAFARSLRARGVSEEEFRVRLAEYEDDLREGRISA